MIENFSKHIHRALKKRSGKVFYSGRVAFSGERPLYILGCNPGEEADAEDRVIMSGAISSITLLEFATPSTGIHERRAKTARRRNKKQDRAIEVAPTGTFAKISLFYCCKGVGYPSQTTPHRVIYPSPATSQHRLARQTPARPDT